MRTHSATKPRKERRRSDRALRVLIVDDEHDTVATLKAVLEDEGHVVQGVLTGAEVLPAARSFRPDAVILDISVPGMSGYAVAQALRHSFTDMRRPLVIGISGVWKEPPDRLVARQVGFDQYLVKPCDPAILIYLLASLKRPS